MRIIIDLPDDAYEAACSLSVSKRISLGEAIARLVEQGLRPVAGTETDKPFPCFVVPQDAEPITLEQTLRAEDEL